MKITVKNLGAVEQAEIDLKPLTVFVGHNGTGKTWTAYALASVFGDYGYLKYFDNFFEEKIFEIYPELAQGITQLLKEGSVEFDIIKFSHKNIEKYINQIAALAPNWMRSYLATRRINFENLLIKIELDSIKKKFFIEKILRLSYSNSLSILSSKLHVYKDENSKQIIFSIESKNIDKLKKNFSKVTQFYYTTIFAIFHTVLFSSTHIFPTERTTVITQPILNKKIGIMDNFDELKKTHSYSKFSFPVLNFIEMISEISSINLDDRKEEAKIDSDIANYIDLADFLEKNIVDGKTDFEENTMNKELLFSTDNIKLEINVTSSMTKELVPLVLYLRYLAEPDDLIVIDEPEMNLHPAAQVEIIEFLAMLVNAGLNVLITTHSPYIIDHISNLIVAKKQLVGWGEVRTPTNSTTSYQFDNINIYVDVLI